MDLVLREMDLIDSDSQIGDRQKDTISYRIPVISSWRLNEGHFGALVGMSKEGAERLYEKKLLEQWRNGWYTPPPPMTAKMVERWKREDHCGAVTFIQDPGGPISSLQPEQNEPSGFPRTSQHDFLSHPIHHVLNDRNNAPQQSRDEKRELHIGQPPSIVVSREGSSSRDLAIWEKPLQRAIDHSGQRHVATWPSRMPASESLCDTYERVVPLWVSAIAPRLRRGQTLLIVAHANTLRSILHSIDPEAVTREAMKSVKIPSAVPLVYSFRPVVTEEDEKKAVPGGLIVVPASNRDCDELEPRRRLNGRWIKTKDIEALSFCTPIGRQNLEHEIA
uniref:Phosphoglycerate mutase n=1 Tax=Odontella aurita TaxID=265563 RepID=A0A7S4MT67_9STRA|mmetsp:Transcript_31166/g.93444  ORF Transcript_31166/g.93444 Transcript_31166/m.93444 type:complete len:334 (+) Transcript_31166:608-1609(+)|eukprot:CAMPEP_0113562796 /NCGR_PEP_ID=MMETSP0015_2-20120614/20718_1 /TAXON_ID=2838 /ORGANISM="Odontella" /LENGTH=333 /DNA_ID=CAMNT_0000464717 /DNA_START=601 /DNA_END=1602 /DNA_ORIENTATION=- /assembly_acc=CAM_ASM_000160